ncbi:alginate lyase family protein [uncultured Maribacter sp.]|uniref:alginate lyase family protein n=1 Tax=uncultured Maribacter sp. TaxID=431308 RepID=UPI00262D106E|nr:alginate lyase family protein [uncultured Maribacter sp.]
MDFNKLKLLFYTLKYLRFKQIYFRGYYLFRNKFFKKEYKKQLSKNIKVIKWQDSFLYTDSYIKNNSFKFLNLEHNFISEIDWNYNAYGKLWTYNLNYFDFLNQKTISSEDGLFLIHDYIQNEANLKDGKEPYPISLRGINWVKFLSKYSISDSEINKNLYNHYQTLLNNLEYHLLGNHLLENGFSLFFGAYYFKDVKFYAKAIHILKAELEEQILNDGAHFELSPMYHQILLHRLLDCISLIKLNFWKEDGMALFLKEKALKMLSWLESVTFSGGNIPMVNDSAFGIAPTSNQLVKYANELGLNWSSSILSDSGYRKFKNDDYELFVDVGNVGPTYQPGHVHSDTFNFELYVAGKPIIVDTGTSTYEKNALRQKERETAAHNTVVVDSQDQTQVWGGFRVAKRAKVNLLEEDEGFVKAQHDGYKKLGLFHSRKFVSKASHLTIEDSFNKASQLKKIAFFHLHPSINSVKIKGNKVFLIHQNIQISFENFSSIELIPFDYATGFNQREKSQKISVTFQKKLKTEIYL